MKKGVVTGVILGGLAGLFVFSVTGAGCDDEGPADAGTGCDSARYSASCLAKIDWACFDPSGKCTAKDLTEFDWANGAQVLTEQAGDVITSVIKNSKGAVCRTYRLTYTGPGMTAYDYSITTGDGKLYKFHTVVEDNVAGDTTITCPDGTTETYTPDDYNTLKACYQSAASSGTGTPSFTGCTCGDGGTNCLTGNNGCTTDSDCADAGPRKTCCDMNGIKFCSETCGSTSQ